MALNSMRTPIPPWRRLVNFSERLSKAPEWESAPAGDCNSAARKLRSYEITQSSDYTAVARRPHRIRGRLGVHLLVDQILDITDDEAETIRFVAECAVTDFSSKQLE